MEDARVPGPDHRESGSGAWARWCAERVSGLPPSVGPVRLVGIDGYAGSGKSTAADRLARELAGAPVVRLDDLADHEAPIAPTGRVLQTLVEPWSRGVGARFGLYDWERRRIGRGVRVPPAPVVILEGVGAARRALRPHLAWSVWMDVPARTARARGRRRDGPEQADFWDRWVPLEREHFANEPSWAHVDCLLVPWRAGYHARVRTCPESDGSRWEAPLRGSS
ncbi:hypothetical protein FNQ90_13925 [Streptomyces alkaliphilus]|uniref:Uridine kinase n=1 Tax=Streptomyces alkaliphilus TaxID=1472722 RepID=A0A7W3TE35_9ACTN|nr:hypothetical protein [Streptomyces alkaliphilus]MBB0245174.1 hypothetical protein [Streptomyces alkaliphilus]